jgi:hypothetical protein
MFDQVEIEHVEETVGLGVDEDGVDESTDLIICRAPGLQTATNPLASALHRPLHRGEQEGVLAPEVIEEESLGDPGLVRDILEGHPVGPVPCHRAIGRTDDLHLARAAIRGEDVPHPVESNDRRRVAGNESFDPDRAVRIGSDR